LIGFFYACFLAWHYIPFIDSTLAIPQLFRNIFWHKEKEQKKFILMKTQVTSIYKQAERFAEITKKSIISGNIVRLKNVWRLLNVYSFLEA
jgi:hypothetical protein